MYYWESVQAAGAGYVVVKEARLPAEAASLLLAGGVDVDPRLYGEKRGPHTDPPKPERDAHELALLREALERDLAVLAICRGHQLLNVAFGGAVLQHIENDAHKWLPDGASRRHEVTLDESGAPGRLAAVYGAGATLLVNSRHHQGVTLERLGDGLRPTALSPDGFVEAVESERHRWVVGVQWHPERPEMRPGAAPLFAAFVAACRG
jgi:gamma-glutamyl-gamma-aminobutyrate hydrolase PuuD